MNIKHQDLTLNSSDPFLHCKLDRKKYAKILTDIVSSYADGFVLAINNEWGTGKTTFLKMWQKSLEMQEFRTCYFNAWQHDFDKSPMVAVISELKAITREKSNDKFKEVLKKGSILLKNLIPALTKGIAKKYIDDEAFVDILEKGADGTTDILKEEIDDYVNKKIGLEEFREALKGYVKENSNQKPLVFIIDELDRCRPDYAVEVLEQVKHFFNVEGIVFILAIDKTQLLYAINGFYGSSQINASEYLRRFIDIEYSLPNPSAKEYCKYLYQYFHFENFFFSDYRSQIGELRNDAELFISFAANLFEYHNLTLRRQEKLFAHSRLALRSFQSNNYNFPDLFIVLIYIRSEDKEFYDKIRRVEFSIQDAVSKLYTFFPKEIDKYAGINFRSVEAKFVFFYYNSYREKYPTYQLLTRASNGSEYSITIQSSFESDDATSRLSQLIQDYEHKYYDIKITFLLDKIDLIENVVS